MKTIAMGSGDFLLDPDDGQILWVEDEDKIVQEVAESLMTELPDNPELNTVSEDDAFPEDSTNALRVVEFGSELHHIERFGLPINSMQAFVGVKVREAINRLVSAQQELPVGALPTSEEVKEYNIQVIPLGNLSFVFYLTVFTVDGSAAKVPEYRIDLSHVTTVQDIIKSIGLGG